MKLADFDEVDIRNLPDDELDDIVGGAGSVVLKPMCGDGGGSDRNIKDRIVPIAWNRNR